MSIIMTMVIIWAVVIGIALYIEFMTMDMSSVWFSVGGIAALISAPCKLPWQWQILLFFAVSFLFLATLRPIVKKYVNNETVPTNVDVYVGKKYKLLKDVNEDRSEIKIGDTFWTVKCEEQLKTGDSVEIIGMEGNKYIVKGETK